MVAAGVGTTGVEAGCDARADETGGWYRTEFALLFALGFLERLVNQAHSVVTPAICSMALAGSLHSVSSMARLMFLAVMTKVSAM